MEIELISLEDLEVLEEAIAPSNSGGCGLGCW